MTYCEIENYYQEGLTFSDNGVAMTNKIHGSASAGTTAGEFALGKKTALQQSVVQLIRVAR